jgi:hypothetical protein
LGERLVEVLGEVCGTATGAKICENCGVAVCLKCVIFIAMSSVQEIEAVIPKLSRAEVEEVRAWIDDFLEDQLELTDEVKAKLDRSRREIAEGNYTTRQPG